MQKNAKNANQVDTMNIVKRIASFCFGVAFLIFSLETNSLVGRESF